MNAMRRSQTVFTIGRVPVRLHPSWLLFAVLVAVVMAPSIERYVAGVGAYLLGFGFAIMILASVLVHEAAHAIVALRNSIGVRSITLHFLGGETETITEAPTPGVEFRIAFAGPVSSIAIGIGSVLLANLMTGLLGAAFFALGWINLVVGVANLAPGLPLDGGRVLRSAAWQISGDRHRGTAVAGWGGRVLALLALCWPIALVWLDLTPTLFTYLATCLVAWLMWTGGSQAIAEAHLRRRIPQIAAREIARRGLGVPAATPVSEALRLADEAGAEAIWVAASDGQVTGIVNPAAVAALPVDQRPWVTAGEVSRSATADMRLPADLVGEDLFRAISNSQVGEWVLVEADGRPTAVLRLADIDAAIKSKGTS